MLLPLQPVEIWDEINQAYQAEFGFSKDNPVKIYPNLYVAVDEVTTQIASFLAHKRAFTWVKGFSPLFEGTLSGFLRDGLQVQTVDWKVYEQVSIDANAWVEALPKDTLFVLGFEDHAVTGQKLDLQRIEEALNQKKIFFVRVSHFELVKPNRELKPFTIWVGPTGHHQSALVVAGSRFRAPERIVPTHPWRRGEERVSKVLLEDQVLVQKFESQWVQECWFSGPSNRRYDRALLSFSDITGDALRFELLNVLGLPQDSEQILTPHVCYLRSIKVLKSWWTPTPDADRLRGMIILSAELLSKPQFAQQFKTCVELLRKKSVWPNN